MRGGKREGSGRKKVDTSRRVNRPYLKCGPKFRVSLERAIDAFGRIKDGERVGTQCNELGVTYTTLRKAFRRHGLI